MDAYTHTRTVHPPLVLGPRLVQCPHRRALHQLRVESQGVGDDEGMPLATAEGGLVVLVHEA